MSWIVCLTNSGRDLGGSLGRLLALNILLKTMRRINGEAKSMVDGPIHDSKTNKVVLWRNDHGALNSQVFV